MSLIDNKQTTITVSFAPEYYLNHQPELEAALTQFLQQFQPTAVAVSVVHPPEKPAPIVGALPGFESIPLTQAEKQVLSYLLAQMPEERWTPIGEIRSHRQHLHVSQLEEKLAMQGGYTLAQAHVGVRLRNSDPLQEVMNHHLALKSAALCRKLIEGYTADPTQWIPLTAQESMTLPHIQERLSDPLIFIYSGGSMVRLERKTKPVELQPLSIEILRDLVIVASGLQINYSAIAKILPTLPPEKDILQVTLTALPDNIFENRPSRQQAIQNLLGLGNKYGFTEEQERMMEFLQEMCQDPKKLEELLRIIAEKPTSPQRR